MTTATKIRPIEQHMMDTKGFYLAKVTMYRQDYATGAASNIVDTYTGYVRQNNEGGIVWMVRPEANMRSRFKTTILTVAQRLISIEKIGA